MFRSYWPPILNIRCAACSAIWHCPDFSNEQGAYPHTLLTGAHCPNCGIRLPELRQLIERDLAVPHPSVRQAFIGTRAGLRDFFAEWQQCKAELWDYVVSHKHLTLRLTHADSRDALLRCVFTRSVHLPNLCWQAKLSLRAAAESELWQLLDEEADVRIVCRLIGVFHDSENRGPSQDK